MSHLHFQAHPRCLASTSLVAAVGRCACAIVPARQTNYIYFDVIPSSKHDDSGGGGYFLRSFWYKIHLPPSRFFSTTIGISRILFPQLFSSKINSLGLTIFLRDSDMFSRGREIITFWWFSNLLFHWIYFYQFCSSTKITQYTFTRKELANPLIIP